MGHPFSLRVKSMFLRLHVILAVLLLCTTTGLSWAGSKERAFFDSVGGVWRGPGEVVAGKYKGTKFVCNFNGGPAEETEVGLSLDGQCRVGIFSQKMSAFIASDRGRYSGRFLDGSKGGGLDIVSGRLKDDKIVVGINRNRLNGAMVAHLSAPDTMNVTISVKVGKQLVPVIGMTLSRERQVGSR